AARGVPRRCARGRLRPALAWTILRPLRRAAVVALVPRAGREPAAPLVPGAVDGPGARAAHLRDPPGGARAVRAAPGGAARLGPSHRGDVRPGRRSALLRRR